jgi:ankyrin repeat protein
VVRVLLEAGADKEVANKNGMTPLNNAALNGHEAVVVLLLEAGADKEAATRLGATPLYNAALKGHEAVVRLLLEAGAGKETANKNGKTLKIAAENGHAAVVVLLLEAGADKEAADNDGWTPLFSAASAGHEAVVRVLLEAGADKEAANNDGATPLYSAAYNGDEAVVRLLLEAGADDRDGRALRYALDGDHFTEARLLLERGVGASVFADLGFFAARGVAFAESLLAEAGIPCDWFPDDEALTARDEEVAAVLAQWRRGEHPRQLARAALEAALLSTSHEAPPDVARLCGDYLAAPRLRRERGE